VDEGESSLEAVAVREFQGIESPTRREGFFLSGNLGIKGHHIAKGWEEIFRCNGVRKKKHFRARKNEERKES